MHCLEGRCPQPKQHPTFLRGGWGPRSNRRCSLLSAALSRANPPPPCLTHSAESTRGELETKHISMTAAVRDMEGERERLLADVGQVHHDTAGRLPCIRLPQAAPCYTPMPSRPVAARIIDISTHVHRGCGSSNVLLLWTVSQVPLLPHCCLPH